MPKTIENLTDKEQLVRGKSGRTWRIGPHETLEDIDDVEVKGNQRIHTLTDRRILKIRDAAKGKVRSTDMTANEAVEHISNTPLEDLANFIAPDEDRVTVTRAMKEKRQE